MGGGSNAMGIFQGFLDDDQVQLVGVEAHPEDPGAADPLETLLTRQRGHGIGFGAVEHGVDEQPVGVLRVLYDPPLDLYDREDVQRSFVHRESERVREAALMAADVDPALPGLDPLMQQELQTLIREVREDLGKLRRTIIDVSGRHGLAPIASSSSVGNGPAPTRVA